jgi:hypothetical protein
VRLRTRQAANGSGELCVPPGVRVTGADERTRVLRRRPAECDRQPVDFDAASAARAGSEHTLLASSAPWAGRDQRQGVRRARRLRPANAQLGRTECVCPSCLPLLRQLQWHSVREGQHEPTARALPKRLQPTRQVRAQLVPLCRRLLRDRLLGRRLTAWGSCGAGTACVDRSAGRRASGGRAQGVHLRAAAAIQLLDACGC